MLVALTRQVSPAITDCQLTYALRRPIDVPRAQHQHNLYEALLARCGARVVSLPPEPQLADAAFVEDTAVVIEELAIMASMGTPVRRPEVSSIAVALSRYRPIRRIQWPGRLEGGDVLRVGRTLFVGLTTRTDQRAIDQLADIVAPYDYRVVAVPVTDCLHLKSACSAIGPRTLLANPAWVDVTRFVDLDVVPIAIAEPHAANTLTIGDRVIMPSACPLTARRLEQQGFTVQLVDISEFQKAEGGVSCMALLFEAGE